MSESSREQRDTAGDIAIIGMSGRFPGAPDLESLWRVIESGTDTLTRWSADADDLDDPMRTEPESLNAYVRARGMLDGIENFDAGFFDFTPGEAAGTDPQHRLWLEVGFEALEAAGYAHDAHQQIISVFAGSFTNTYLLHNLLADRTAVEEYVRMRKARSFATLLQNDAAFLPTRTAYKLGLRGPAINVQTACSTSLVAVVLAMQSLRAYESDIALAGGVCISVPQRSGYFYQQGAIFARDGVCRPYDADACGTVIGNGAGAVVLKRRADAERDRDPIHALILGGALNNDGRLKVSFAAPSVVGQAEVIVAAQTLAGVSPDSIGYVEGHGTATPIGDPIEVEALDRAFRHSTRRTGFCALGSLKGNVGHLDAAAGVAGLLRAVLALQHQTLPPTAHFTKPNPELRLAQTPFFVLQEAMPWPETTQPRRAAVSSFGIGGTNAHVILEAAPEPRPSTASPNSDGPHVLLLSAKSRAALDANTERLASWFERTPDVLQSTSQSVPSLADAAYVLRHRRKLFEHRRAVTVRCVADAGAALRTPERWSSGRAVDGPAKLFFVFPGQGSLRAGVIARLLRAEPELLAHLTPPTNAASTHLGFDLLAWFQSDTAELASLGDNAAVQLSIFCVDLALTRFLQARGVQPDGVLGHSLGEWVAAHVAGVLELEQAVRAVYHRGRLMQGTGTGAALIVRLSEHAVAPYLASDVTLACVNGPQLVLLTGRPDAIAHAAARLVDDGVAHRLTPIDLAVHSPHMDAVVEPFHAELAALSFKPAQLPLLCTASGEWLRPEQSADSRRWAQQLRQQVNFDRAAHTLRQEPRCIALEVGLGSSLTTLLAARLSTTNNQRALSVLGRDDRANQDASGYAADRLQRCLGELWCNGVAIELVGKLQPPLRAPVLPSYAFQRQRCWVEAPVASAYSGPVEMPSTPPSVPPSVPPSATTRETRLRSQITQTIARMSHLPVERLDPDSRFTDLGLDSLFLAQLVETLGEKLGLQVPFSLVVQHDSIGALAEALAVQLVERAFNRVSALPGGFSGLVPLRLGDGKLPLLLVHGDGADHFLAEHVGPEQDLHGYLHQGSDGEAVELTSVEALAARCHAEWRAVCGDKPCVLVGHSFGGLVAYHVAHLRRREGLPVAQVILIDTFHPDAMRPVPDLSVRGAARHARALLHTLAWQADIARAQLQLKRGKNIAPDERSAYVVANYELACRKYSPPSLDVDVLLMRAENARFTEPTGMGWPRLLKDRLDQRQVPGTHLSIVRTKKGFDPIGRAIAEKLASLRSKQRSVGSA